jgi:hypothetical protein
VLLSATDFSPANFAPSKDGRIFELRTYLTTKDNLKNLHSRFRDHTVKLFEKHGMTNIAYYKIKGDVSEANNLVRALSPDMGKSNPKGVISSENGLIYLLAHKDKDAAKASFDAFRKDADWVKARDASEKAAGGSLTEKDGVISVFLKPTEFSPLK